MGKVGGGQKKWLHQKKTMEPPTLQILLHHTAPFVLSQIPIIRKKIFPARKK
jgi:hypothetical protein